MNRLLVISTAFVLAITAGCNRGTDSAEGNGPRVAFVMKTLNNPFFIEMERGAQDAAKKAGIVLNVQAAEREVDVERQMQIVENVIQTGIAALCLTPSGSREVIPAIAKANEAGIPVLIVDSGIDEEAAKEAGIQTVTFIGSDNYEGGHKAGQHLVEIFNGKANIAILEGIPGHETHDMRIRGFRDAIKVSTEMNVLSSQPANTERDQGYNVTQNILQRFPDLQAIFATNDMMALGAVKAIEAAGRTGQIKVVGFDAVDDARDAIRAGTMEASIAQSPYDMGRVAIETVRKVLDGETIPKYIPIPIELITKANVD